MTDELGPIEAPEEPASEPPRSRLDALKARRAELGEERHLDLDVPGYGGDLVARYRVPPAGELDRVAKRISKLPEGERLLAATISQVILACDSMWIRVNGELEPLDPNDTLPVRYDHRLAEALGIEITAKTTAAEVVKSVFVSGTGLNVAALSAHASQLGEWMIDTSRDVDEDFLGESEATTR